MRTFNVGKHFPMRPTDPRVSQYYAGAFCMTASVVLMPTAQSCLESLVFAPFVAALFPVSCTKSSYCNPCRAPVNAASCALCPVPNTDTTF
mmetsp:Transcript_31494/g.66256  ORF Transcript_31494/g.66256 Transcript_31494/m.66256 type:complete len:91 (+) Transcript_31494:934-1206(+)